ncbi:MAG: MBL fold metallo-hydrolase [Myxococcales bacterium]|nr:MBL fold metallo-hydrolase [Myxococcales bacterium]
MAGLLAAPVAPAADAADAVATAGRAFGSAATGERRRRMEASSHWTGKVFENTYPLWNDYWGMVTGAFDGSPNSTPPPPPPVVTPDPELFLSPPPSGLRITWLGHSTTLIEIDGRRFLTDPVWGERTSPFTFAGPKRWYAPPLPLEGVPPLDAVLISHDHYDHLDMPTIERMKHWDTTFVTALGVGAHLEYWGVPASRIVELDWGDEWSPGEGTTIVCAQARHASGRHLFDQNATLWAGYAVIGPKHRVYFSGDTGMFPELADIGREWGPFDVTMVEVGAYHRAWPDWHMGPEQAVAAHHMLRGRVFIPIHWGLFDLALHGWTEPVERTLVAAEEGNARVLVPRPGESLEPGHAKATARWWPTVPWQTAAEHPIVARGLPDKPAETASAK